MKKLIVIACMTAMVGAAVSAHAAKQWYGGLKAGANFADFSGDDAGDVGMRTGFMGGGFLGCDFTPDVGARLEGLYVMKGAEGQTDPGDGHMHDATFKLDYIEFPVLLVVNFPAGDAASFNLFAGPTFGFNISAEEDVAEHGSVDFGDDFVNSFEFGAAIGGGIEYKLSSASITGDVRYSLGASSVFNDVGGESSDVKNRGVGLMVGLKFPFGGGE